MGQDRSYDRGRAWRGGNEEDGGYGQRGMEGDDEVMHRPRYGRYPGGASNGGIDYPEVSGRGRDSRGYDRQETNASYRGAGSEAGMQHETRGSHAGRGPKNYRRSDERIGEDIHDALTRNPFLDATEIEVRVEHGEVTLEGEVDSRASKRLAEDISEAVTGVLDVHNRLTIRTGGSVRRDPDPIDPPTL